MEVLAHLILRDQDWLFELFNPMGAVLQAAHVLDCEPVLLVDQLLKRAMRLALQEILHVHWQPLLKLLLEFVFWSHRGALRRRHR